MTAVLSAPPPSLEAARAFRREGRSAEAQRRLQRWLEAHPCDVDGLHEWGNLLKAAGQFSAAVAPLLKAARIAPRQAAIWLNLGVALLELSHHDEAVAAFERAVALEPKRPEALNILGHACLARGDLSGAAETLETALKLRPGYGAALDNLGRVRKAQGRSAEALDLHRRAVAAGGGAGAASNFLYTLNFVAGLSPAEIFAEHARWGAALAAGAGPSAAVTASPREQGRRIRVGYVSPDFCRHAVSYFFEPVLAGHDRARIETFCYSDVRVADAVTLRLRSLAEHWREAAGWSDDTLAAQVRRDGIDILVDLAGHTARHRLGVFARRAAPAQVTWLGYPNTTGLSAMDYRFTDAISDPPGRTEAWHTERLVRLPGPFSCYRPPAEAPAVSALPALETGKIAFGCFNHLAKITPEVIAVWSALLCRVGEATLLLKARGIDEPTRRRLLENFAALGVEAGRVEVIGDQLSVRDHLALYGRVDLALDCFPYNGTTTTCEALWMGVPVVTLAGETHAARVGASLLTHAGLPDWIAASAGDYLERAAGAAANLPALGRLRSALRNRVAQSPLCAEKTFVEGVEAAFAAMVADSPA